MAQTGLVDRRDFLKRWGSAAAAGRILPFAAATAPGQAPDRFLAQLGKDPRLIVHNSRPGVLETPMALLREHRLTPKEILFVRNNQVPAGGLSLEPLAAADWGLELTGLVEPARTVGLADLAGLEQTEVEAVLQCSGNGRAFYALSAKTRGTQWKRGGMGQLRWAGVRLQRLLEALRVRVGADAEFLIAEGRDEAAVPTGDDFEQCVPLSDVLGTALLALRMNGHPIPALHGGPLRLVLPGYYGTMNVKWLSQLRFVREPSTNRHHAQRYRTFRRRLQPGSAPAITPEATVPTWRQRLKSVIWDPEDGASAAPGPLAVSGVAWNDGRTEIVSVEVSGDGGATWRRADFDAPPSPYGWYRWTGQVDLAPGVGEVRARALDAQGRSQPPDGSVHWNPSGYEWHGVDRVELNRG